jgi:hypothetical protein
MVLLILTYNFTVSQYFKFSIAIQNFAFLTFQSLV